jgi:hypothetical protein
MYRLDNFQRAKPPTGYFFLCLFFLRRFLRLCVAILCFFLFFPLGIVMCYNYFKSFRYESTVA